MAAGRAMIDGGELDDMLDDLVRTASGSALVVFPRDRLDAMRAVVRKVYDLGLLEGRADSVSAYQRGYQDGLARERSKREPPEKPPSARTPAAWPFPTGHKP
jgi:hypothetical protein